MPSKTQTRETSDVCEQPGGTDTGSIPPRLSSALSGGAFVAFLLLLAASLGAREFWTDEVITAGHVVGFANTKDAFHPRGYYVLLYGWKLLAGDGDLALRAFALPWAALAFLLLTAFGRRVLEPRRLILAQWLFALSPFVILYFRMARFYSMVTALALLVAYCAALVIQEGRWRHWLCLAGAAFALLNTNYIAAAMLGPLFLWLAVIALRRGQVARWLAAGIPSLALVALIVPALIGQAREIHNIEAATAQASPVHLLLRIGLPVYSLCVGETTDPWRVYITVPAFIAAGLALLLGLRKAKGGQGDQAHALVRWAWPLSILIVAILLSTLAKGEPLASAARSTIFAAPFAYMLMALGIFRIRKPTLRATVLAVILVANAYGLRNYFTGQQFLNPNYVVPWREIARTIQEREQPTDMVLAYYDTTIERYGSFHNFIYGRPDFFPERLVPVHEWPSCGRRLWLIARDRGSAEARRLQNETIQRLIPRAGKVEIYEFLRYSPIDRRFREAFLRRKVEDAYVKVYLFCP